jgi:hypothetical protein
MSSHQPTTSSRFRAPQRISITLPQHVFEALIDRSAEEGRSLSNLSAYLLECSLQIETGFQPGNLHPMLTRR